MARSKVGAALTKARPKTHGSFDQVANASWEMMRTMAGLPNWTKMTDTQRMAVQEVIHKMARIGCGDHMHEDHWNDIAGYGELGAKTTRVDEPVRKKRKAKSPTKKAAPKKSPTKKAVKRPTRPIPAEPAPAPARPPRQRRRREEAPAQEAAE